MTRGGHVERHRLRDAIAVHRVREFEADVDAGSVRGTVLNLNPSVVAWNKFGDRWKRGSPLLNWNQDFETHRGQRNAAHTSIVRGLPIVVVGRERWSERIVLVRVEQVSDDDVGLEGGGDPTLALAILRPSCGFIDVCVQEPEQATVGAVECLPRVKSRSRRTPKTFLSKGAIGAWELILVGRVTPLHQVPTVLKSWVDRSQIEHVREDTSGVGGGIEVVQGIPVILATSKGLAEIHVEEGVGSQVVTSVALPSLGGSHGLTSESNNISMMLRVQNH